MASVLASCVRVLRDSLTASKLHSGMLTDIDVSDWKTWKEGQRERKSGKQEQERCVG